MNPYAIIKQPLITERTTDLKERNKYVFIVDPNAKKTQIRLAIEKLFKVRVQAVNTCIMHGKQRRVGANVGFRSDWKKAIVTVHAGQRIDFERI